MLMTSGISSAGSRVTQLLHACMPRASSMMCKGDTGTGGTPVGNTGHGWSWEQVLTARSVDLPNSSVWMPTQFGLQLTEVFCFAAYPPNTPVQKPTIRFIGVHARTTYLPFPFHPHRPQRNKIL
eukprot:1217798-Amphidinium_carterae.1